MDVEHNVRDERRASNDSRATIPGAPAQASPVERRVSLGQKWREARLSKTVAFWLAVAVVALTIFVGFKWGGWVTGGTAQSAADTASQAAVISRLAPICVAQFNLDPQKAQKLSELKAMTNAYSRTSFVQTQTWAIMPDETNSSSRVAEACAGLLFGS